MDFIDFPEIFNIVVAILLAEFIYVLSEKVIKNHHIIRILRFRRNK
ncbi:MAG: hypothetical protein Q8N08_05105 [Methanobacteriaceae archaeon]|nr:hypothetical protein [Methanobacteriaceae archaeon]